MEQQIIEQGSVVRANPPSRLIWYFQALLAQKKMAPVLASMGIQSILQL
ncbi:restriction endonuclease fold toxin 5 domain-containing protein [Robbsia andropogonis]